MYSIFNIEQLQSFRQQHQLQPYKIRQIEQEIFHNARIDFTEMTTLSKDLREKLKDEFYVTSLEVDEILEDDQTTKFLFNTADGESVETVIMYHYHTDKQTGKKKLNRTTLCISSQVGCNVGCIFCVTGKLGLKKNLKREEILGQVLFANHYLRQKLGKKDDGTYRSIRNVVFMGMGEPMLNYRNVKTVCEYLTDTHYFGLSRRRVTISTSGVTPQIKKFLEDNLPVSFAFSIHAPNQELREKLIPTIAKFYKLDELMQCMDQYTKQTGQPVFYEYVMIKDVNDMPEIAHQAGKLLRGRHGHLNLIPYNENPAIDLEESEQKTIRKFQHIVQSYDVPCTVRTNMGRKEKSACGQLGYKKLLEKLQERKTQSQ